MKTTYAVGFKSVTKHVQATSPKAAMEQAKKDYPMLGAPWWAMNAGNHR